MRWYSRFALGMAVYLLSVSAIMGHEPPAKAKPKIELRWIEGGHIEGLTESKGGFPGSESRGDVVYPHKKPALVLTPAEIEEVSIRSLSLSSTSKDQFGVTIQLTKKARKTLAKSVKGKKTRWITVAVDGYCWGYSRYEPSDAMKYKASMGYTPSLGYVQRIVDALSIRPTVKLRWIEHEHIEGLTIKYGATYLQKRNIEGLNVKHGRYRRKNPALVITPAEIADVVLHASTFDSDDPSSDSSTQYMVKITLTQKAREAVAKSADGTKTRLITVDVDGYCWGKRRYEPLNEKSGVISSATWARNYNPSIGPFESKEAAQRIVDALK